MKKVSGELRFDIVSIFPEAFSSPLSVSLIGKAVTQGIIEIEVHDLRDWADLPHRKVDDTPLGGGAGMVMMPGPIVDAVEAVKRSGGRVVLLSAAGRRFTQAMAHDLAAAPQVVLVCGRYEGVDERVIEITGAEPVSVGDYVLAGGEVAALVVVEAVARLVPGVLGNEASTQEESFVDGLLEYPHYTRPATFRGIEAPEALLSGDHERIAQWRREQALRKTAELRPDLLP
jgi:tRNA (guanine37-N1)-methyltransferase